MKYGIQLLVFCCSCQFFIHATTTNNLRGVDMNKEHRELSSYYHVVRDSTELGEENVMAALNNPLKGLVSSPRWKNPNKYPDDIPNAIEFYYIGFDEVMIGNPDIVGEENAFDWTVLENALNDTASRHKHTVFRIFIHYPTKVLRLPLYLIEEGVLIEEFQMYGKTEYAPHYGDKYLLTALEQFIRALGAKYDGDPRIIAIQMGLLGFWGEWHTFADPSMLPESSKQLVTRWYKESFSTTQILTRYPNAAAVQAGLGFHDDSFAFSTLDGDANGGVKKNWYFWPQIQALNGQEFWRTGLMGGETRPELQGIIFTDEYEAGTLNKQDFDLCVQTTHATFMLHHNAFNTDYEGTTLQNARSSIAKMGYNFKVTKVALMEQTSSLVSIDVTVEQIGVAPFYFPLSLKLECPDLTTTKEVPGVEDIEGYGEFETFRFEAIPASSDCLHNVRIRLVSSHVNDEERPILFAQGDDGIVSLVLPTPEEGGNFVGTKSPTASQVTSPSTPADTSDEDEVERVGVPGAEEDPACTNLISNSNMESGHSGFWQADSSFFGGFSTDNHGVSGSKAIRYRKPIFQSGSFKYKGDINVSCLTPGSVYQISAYIKLVARSGRTSTCSGNDLCPKFDVSVRSNTGSIMARNGAASYDNIGDFSHYTSDLVIPSDGSTAAEMKIQVTGFNALWDVVIDDFEIKKE